MVSRLLFYLKIFDSTNALYHMLAGIIEAVFPFFVFIGAMIIGLAGGLMIIEL